VPPRHFPTVALTEGYGSLPGVLGVSFNVPAATSAGFVDSTVRAGVPYQLSRLLTPMLRAVSRAGRAYDPGGSGSPAAKRSIVVGRGVGRLVECACLEPAGTQGPRDPLHREADVSLLVCVCSFPKKKISRGCCLPWQATRDPALPATS
jgi:hypothetical protein